MQRAGRKIRRADVRKLRIGEPDAKLTTVGGLVSFNAFAREQGLHRELSRRFGHLKTGRGVVYPMGAQMQLLLDMSVAGSQRWITVERDAFDKPTRQVAEIDFEREGWPPGKWRVFAMRTNERLSGSQSGLWEDLDFSVHVYATNDPVHDADDLARRYDDRAGIEPLIGELKGGFGIGKVSTHCFDANEAAFLLKVLAFNLLRRWVQHRHRVFASWRTPWIRRVCVHVPGRLLRSGGRWELRLAPRPMLS